MDNLGDLTTHLFDQINRLNDDTLTGEQLAEEVKRASSMSSVSKQIIDIANITLEAEKFKDSKWNADAKLPNLLSDGNE